VEGLEASREQRGTGMGTRNFGDARQERELRRILYEERDCDGTVIINKKINGGERERSGLV